MKKFMLALLVLASGSAFANSACDTPRNDFDGLYCLNKVYQEADKELNANYKKLSAQLDASGKQKRRLGIQAANLVKIHMTLEEEFFYPALRGKGDDDKITEGLVEHDTGKFLINDILSPETDDDSFGPKLQVLGEQMEHHHKEE